MSIDHHPALGGPAGFLRALFDLSFRRLITPRLIKVLYVLWLAITVLVLIAITVSIFDGEERARTVEFGRGGFVAAETEDGGSVLGGLAFLFLGAPLLFLLSAIAGRVQLEFLIALFQVAENTGAMREALGGTPAGGPRAAAADAGPGGGPVGPAPGAAPQGGAGPSGSRHDDGPDDGPLFGGRGPQAPTPGA